MYNAPNIIICYGLFRQWILKIISKRLALIATAARNKELQPVLTLHPQKVLNWIFRSYTEVGTQRTMIVAILAAYKLLNLKATQQASYAMYLEQYERLDAQLRDRAKDNVPTERQRAGFVSYVELQKVRKKLTFGSKERLLLSFYWTPFLSFWYSCFLSLIRKMEIQQHYINYLSSQRSL